MRITSQFMLVFGMALTLAGASSQSVVAQQAASPERVKQIALTDGQIDDFLAAQKEIGPIIAKAPQGDQPDPKVMEQLETVAKKHKFATYDEYDDVAENIGLVMGGIDPETKKYVGEEAVIKKEIATIDSEKLAPNDKKGQLDELQSELKEPAEPLKFPANIDLVVKNYDKLIASMPPIQ
jgi:hypothetical protein